MQKLAYELLHRACFRTARKLRQGRKNADKTRSRPMRRQAPGDPVTFFAVLMLTAGHAEADDAKLHTGSGRRMDQSARIKKLPVKRGIGIGERKPEAFHGAQALCSCDETRP